MKLRKLSLSLIIAIITLMVTSIFNASYATVDPVGRYLNVKALRASGYGYQALDKVIFKIYETNNSGTTINYDHTVYCLKGGPGFGGSALGSNYTNDILGTQRHYTVYFDMKKPSEISNYYREAIPDTSTSTYKSLLWLLENVYVAPKQTASQSELENAAEYKSLLLSKAGITDNILTDDDIDVVQQLAVWHFTNNDGYKVENKNADGEFSLFINYTSGDNSNYNPLDDEMGDGAVNGNRRLAECVQLYQYLVGAAEGIASTYEVTTATCPYQLDKTLTMTQTVEGDNYIIGPFKINKVSNTTGSLTATIKNGTQTITPTLKDADNHTYSSVSDVIGKNFYIVLPKTTTINNISLEIGGSYFDTAVTYWSVVEGQQNSDQPVVEVIREKKTYSDSVSFEPKSFDLALRKYITKINGVNVANSRVPSVNTSTLTSGTTATYKHRKDLVSVKPGSTVTYNLTIYNEGTAAGRATKIVDQLPTGLTFSRVLGNVFDSSYDSTTNKLTLTRKSTNTTNLSGFTSGTTLQSETIEIECTVGTSDSIYNKVLTNVAWISEEVNSETGETIINQDGLDRDSKPGTNPSVNKDNMDNYTGNENKEDLADSNYYYKGQEDDDDFEKLIVQPKIFDLALRKYITKINGTTVTNTRVPNIDESTLTSGTTATYKHRKDPLEVEKGDKVIYKLTIYNEGEKPGRATKIIDQLPDGLDFVRVVSGNFEVDTETVRPQDMNTSKQVWLVRKQGNTDNLAAYTAGNLASETIEIECLVTAKPGTVNDNVLTNVAWISEEFDAETGTLITNQPAFDRDSTPSIRPNVEYDNMQNYKGNGNKGDLTDSEYYYKGQEDDDDFEKLVIKAKPFDLALRKYITKVNGTAVTDTRVPSIDKSTLTSGTTATYKHRKDPIEVEKGDTVIYNLTIYNEGKAAGRATKIVDQLPEGLKFERVVSGNFKVDTETVRPQDMNTSKQVWLVRKEENTDNLAAYIGENLASETIEIECSVTAKAGSTDKILTNVAWISEEYNAEREETITDREGLDRDSIPSVRPNVEYNNMENYTGNENKEDLTDSEYYYKGQEDDDDFEKLVIKAKEFDLALRKFIVKIGDHELTGEESREPQITTAEIEALARKEASLDDGTTARKVHGKNALEVKTGDIVRYTIRVYNEGEIDALVKEVTDYLPTGLEYVNNDFNRGQGWTLESDGKTVKTVKFANTVLKAFDGTTLKYLDVQIECKVIAKTQSTDNVLKNIAEITEATDEDGDDVTDRDSTPDNVRRDEYGVESQEDDDDFEQLIIPGRIFDLSLRKFITAVNGKELVDDNGKYIREPKVSVTTLLDGETTAVYEHSKVAVNVGVGDEVVYTIRVYNEGEIAGYVDEITDHLPPYLEFINDEENSKYGWKISSDGRTVTTDITSKDTEYSASRDTIYANRTDESDKVLLQPFDSTSRELDYIDVKIKCKVKDTGLPQKITNIAEITEASDENGEEIEDRDSEIENVDLPNDSNLPSYKDDEIEEGEKYIPGQEDDDDFEKVIIQKFDLALRKFITAVDNTQITNRVPIVTMDDNNNFQYTHPKTPVEVATGNIVTYTLRIYNEGNVAGYADEIKDDLPEGLEYLPENSINKEYRWKMYKQDGTETTNIKEAKTIRTDYLSKEQADATNRDNLLKAFNKNTMTQPDYRDVKIAFKVTEPNTSDRILINIAEISEDSDEDGQPIDDIDSTPDNDKEKEDDIDIEKVKVKYFDLALEKIVTEVIIKVDGKTTTTKTGHKFGVQPEPVVKNEIKEYVMERGTVKYKYQIKVTNQGEIAGFAEEVKDYIPAGMKFVQSDNPKWKLSSDGKTITTDQLKNTLLKPGESAIVEITLQWINGKDNLGQKQNWAEISEDSDENHEPIDDIDSIPDNYEKTEDDIDEATVVLSVVTGLKENGVWIIGGMLVIISAGIVLIKKYVI